MWPFDWLFGKSSPTPQQRVVSLPLPAAPPPGAPVREARRPRILISGGDQDSKSVAAMVTQIRMAGAEPVVVVDHTQRLQQRGDAAKVAAEDLADVDALVVMGNNADINPAKYGQAKHEKTNIDTNFARTAYEEAALKFALERKMPVLGVCGGMQLMNVLEHDKNSGTLEQHVEGHAQGDAPFVPVQFVKIEKDTMLSKIAGSLTGLYTPQHGGLPPDVVMENSFHHQAVKNVHKEFRVAARSEDGVTEAIEPKPDGRYGEQFALGVQWHLEFGASDLGAKIAIQLTEEARAYAQHKTPEVAAQRPAAITPGEQAARILAQRQKNTEYKSVA